MQAWKALTALSGLLLVFSSFAAFVVLGSAFTGNAGFGSLNAVGLIYAGVIAALPVICIAFVFLGWRSKRRGRVRQAQWLAGIPILVAVGSVTLLIAFHFAPLP